MGWRIVYLEEAESAKLYLDNIKIIRSNLVEITIPLSDIHTLIIDNPKISLTVQLINKCSEYNVNLILCGIDHMPATIIQPFSGNKMASLVLRKQLRWEVNMKSNVHQKIIQNKIRNQRRTLEFFNASKEVIDKLGQYEREVSIGDKTNREGLAAKVYFRELFGEGFKRFEEDVINAGLNFGYHILRSQISKSLMAKGLHPTFGIIHNGPENSFNLSDDIIEPFRPMIDFYCKKNLVKAQFFKKEHRMGLVKITSTYLIYGDSKHTMFNVINLYIEGIIYFFETGDMSKLLDIQIPYEKI